MIEADLIREGLFFPTFPFRHAIETEVLPEFFSVSCIKWCDRLGDCSSGECNECESVRHEISQSKSTQYNELC